MKGSTDLGLLAGTDLLGRRHMEGGVSLIKEEASVSKSKGPTKNGKAYRGEMESRRVFLREVTKMRGGIRGSIRAIV